MAESFFPVKELFVVMDVVNRDIILIIIDNTGLSDEMVTSVPWIDVTWGVLKIKFTHAPASPLGMIQWVWMILGWYFFVSRIAWAMHERVYGTSAKAVTGFFRVAWYSPLPPESFSARNGKRYGNRWMMIPSRSSDNGALYP